MEQISQPTLADDTHIIPIKTPTDQITRLKRLYELSMKLSGDPMDIFVHVAKMIGELLDVKVVCLSEIHDRELHFLSVYVKGEIFTNAGICPLDITPCATVEATKDLRVIHNVANLFPQASFLKLHDAFSYCGFPALDNNGKVVAVTCLLDDRPHDFTTEDQELLRIVGQRIGLEIERKQLDMQNKAVLNSLIASEQQNRLILDNAGDGVIILDEDTAIQGFNLAAQKLFGYSVNDVLGVKANLLFNAPNAEHSNNAYSLLLKSAENTGAHVTQELLAYCKNQSCIAVEISLGSLLVAEKPIYCLIVRDISERKRTEAELQRHRYHLESLVKTRTSELEAVNQELEAFSYSVSHDLRAPLRSIDGFSQALIEDYQDKFDEVGRDYLHRVRAASRRMANLIDDLLTLSRITRATLKHAPVDLTQLAGSAVMQLQQAFPNHQVKIVIQPGVTAIGDPGLLKIVIENLIGNAWKYSSKTSQPTIEFGSQNQSGETIYFVKDNGVGFDMQYVEKLFVAFQRLHHHEQFEGIGIGLATVKRIISRHNGKIWAESEVGQQTIFYFSLANIEIAAETTATNFAVARP